MKRRISIRTETWPSLIPFRIANVTFDDFPLIVCSIEQEGVTGSGEALGVYYLDETLESMAAEIESISAELEGGADRPGGLIYMHGIVTLPADRFWGVPG